MWQTRICKLLGIRYPIIEAGMANVSLGELAAAVSNAGGLGMIAGALGARRAREEIQKAKALTDKPFAINLPHLIFRRWEPKEMWEVVDMAIEEGLKIAVTSSGDPGILIGRLKEAGLIVMHVGSTVSHARGAEAVGADAFIAAGAEAGGGASREQIGNLVLIPQVVEAVRIPAIAAGGIIDARGFIAALALGAEGVYIGTRLAATHESPTSPQHKEAILKARDDSTTIREGGRRFRQEFIQEIFPGAQETYTAGQGAGLIKEILSVQQVIDKIIDGATPVLERLHQLGKAPPRAS